MNTEQRNYEGIWLGVGIGIGTGGLIGAGISHIITKKREKKKAEKQIENARETAHATGWDKGYSDHTKDAIEEARKAYKKRNIKLFKKYMAEHLANDPEEHAVLLAAYNEGIKDATEEAQMWIEEHVVVVSDEEVEQMKKDAEQAEMYKADEEKNNVQENPSEVKEIKERVSAKDVWNEADNKYAEDEDMLTFNVKGVTLRYPKRLFFDKNSESVGEVKVRSNLKEYEHDILKLKLMWIALGFGEYVPDPEDGYCLTDSDIDNMDLAIDDSDDMFKDLGDEPEEKTIERMRYLDEVDRYIGRPEEGPRIISQKEYNDECYLDKITVDYYEVDNKFIDNTDMDNEIDGVTMFGVSNGNELFGKYHFDEEEDDNDPDVVYVKNFKMNTVAEITRFHSAYQSIKDGSAYFDGGSDQS